MLQRLSRNVLGNAAAAVDRAATLAAAASSTRARRRSRAESLGHEERIELLSRLAERYEELGADADYFRQPRELAPTRRAVRSLSDGGAVFDLSWPSDYRTYLPELSERFGRYPSNQLACARLFAHPEPRPTLILIHGYLGGQHAAEERVWPVSWFYRRGLDVALFVLPFHGLRGERARRGPPPFPGTEPRFTAEGFRQAMGDLVDLVTWLRARSDPPRDVGVMGMSLGGYSTSLLATISPDLAFAIPVIPLACMADFARDQGRLGASESQTLEQHRALRRVHRPVSPLARKPLLPRERLLVIGAEADRITPVQHARRLASHFDAPLETWHGGHLLQLGRSEKFRRVGRYLTELGVLEPRPGG